MSRTFSTEAWEGFSGSVPEAWGRGRVIRMERKGLRSKRAVGQRWRGWKAEANDAMMDGWIRGTIQGTKGDERNALLDGDDDDEAWESFKEKANIKYVVLRFNSESEARKSFADVLSLMREERASHHSIGKGDEHNPDVSRPDRDSTSGGETDDAAETEQDDESLQSSSQGLTDSMTELSPMEELPEHNVDAEVSHLQGTADFIESVSRASTGLLQEDGLDIDQVSAPHETHYEYNVLPTTNDGPWIRLLHLEPGTGTDAVVCTLTQHKLDSCPPYEALSYCWGPIGGESFISVDEANFEVRYFLMHALYSIRLSDKARCVWIDAVCINQADVDERADQVSVMRQIYERAERVLIWVGAPDDISTAAFDMLAAIAREARVKRVDTDTQSLVDYHNLTGTYAFTELTPIGSDASKQYKTDTVRLLLCRDWFSRVWVIQEVGVARDAVIIWGNDELDWQTFKVGLSSGLKQDLFHTKFLGLMDETVFRRFEALAAVQRTKYGDTPAARLLQMLMVFRGWDATDQRDKVFALLGLVGSDPRELGIIPDYHSSVVEVYRRTASQILQHSSDLRLLCSCATRLGSAHEAELPSWVPDWSNQAEIALSFDEGVVGSFCTSRASGPTLTACKIREDGAVLGLDGYPVDSIVEIASVLPTMIQGEEYGEVPPEWDTLAPLPIDFQSWAFRRRLAHVVKMTTVGLRTMHGMIKPFTDYLSTFIEWEKFAKIHGKGVGTPTGESNKAVYMQTLIAGCVPTDLETVRREFEEWLDSLAHIRRLVRLGMDRQGGAFVPIAMAGYMRKTWQKYHAFNALLEHAVLRRLARTSKGHLALVPAHAEIEDVVGVFKGGRWPLVFRSHEQGEWTIVGECHVHGIMLGDTFQEQACKRVWFH